jgi:hypothetical protein
MKKFILILTLAGVSGIVFAQLKSSVIKNTANEEVFSINYGSGVATAKVAVVEATTVSATTVSGSVSAPTITLSGATGIVSTAAALAAPTNAAAAAGLRVRVNGTNYIIRLFAN